MSLWSYLFPNTDFTPSNNAVVSQAPSSSVSAKLNPQNTPVGHTRTFTSLSPLKSLGDTPMIGTISNPTHSSIVGEGPTVSRNEDPLSLINSAYEAEMASAAKQFENQMELIRYSNSETERMNEISRLWQESQAKTAYDRSSYEAKLTRDWQEKMSNTAYQRTVKDLLSAGLNPILAYTNGPASTPAGATGSAQMASVGAMSSASGTASKANSGSSYDADRQLLLRTVNTASSVVGVLGSIVKSLK